MSRELNAPPKAASGGSLARSGAISMAGAGTGAIIGYIVTAVIGNALGTSGAGRVYAVIAIFTIACNVLELGADTALVRFMSRFKALRRPETYRPTLVVAIIPVLVIGIPISAVLAWIFPDLRPIVFLVLVASLLQVVLGATRGLGSVVPFTLIANIGLPTLRLALVAGAAIAGLGVTGVLQAWAAPFAIALLAACIVLSRLVRSAPKTKPSEITDNGTSLWRSFWGFSSARGFAAAVEITLEWSDVLLLGLLSSPAEAGIYAVVTRCVRAGQIVDQAVRVAVSPTVSAAFAVEDYASVSRSYLMVSKAMVVLQWPFYILLAVFGPWILAIFGKGFNEGSPALALMSVTMLVSAVAGMVQTLLLMGGRSGWQLTNKSIVLAFSVGLNLIVIPHWGFMGAAMTWSLATLLDIGLAAFRVFGSMKIRPSLGALLPVMAIPVVIFGGGGLLLRWMDVGLGFTLGGIALLVIGYVAAVFLMRNTLGLAGPIASVIATVTRRKTKVVR